MKIVALDKIITDTLKGMTLEGTSESDVLTNVAFKLEDMYGDDLEAYTKLMKIETTKKLQAFTSFYFERARNGL